VDDEDDEDEEVDEYEDNEDEEIDEYEDDVDEDDEDEEVDEYEDDGEEEEEEEDEDELYDIDFAIKNPSNLTPEGPPPRILLSTVMWTVLIPLIIIRGRENEKGTMDRA